MATAPSRRARTQLARTPLTREDWIDAAIDVMAKGSVEQVMIERLGAMMSVSRGSFYWHFHSRDELLQAILDRWTQTATLGVNEHLDRQEPDPARRLLLYMQLPLKSPRSLRAADLELAILGWARRSALARTAVARVDAIRTRHLNDLFVELGCDGLEGRRRAHLTYAFMRYIAWRRDMSVESRRALINATHRELVSGARRGTSAG